MGTDWLTYLFALTCVAAAVYVVLSRDLLRASIVFFIELASVGGLLLSLGADYLAMVMFAVAVVGTMLVVLFSSIIMGSLKESFGREAGGGLLARALGMALGLGIGVAIGWALLSLPPAEVALSPEADVAVLGRAMLGDHVAVFELLAVLVLATVIGAGLLLRRPENAR